ncbi:tetratricopeptide repeat protein [Bacteroidales bacterium AH-315-N07]|nr:tetratricopeptide repeat protein [Bacteroidales bacterium AH-315-N07]
MKSYKYIFLLLLLFPFYLISEQNQPADRVGGSIQHKKDSLETTPKKTTLDSLIQNLKFKIQNSQEDTHKVNLLHKLAWKLKSNNPDLALSYAQQQLKLAQKLNYQKGIANAINNLGVINTIQGNYTSALDYYFRSLKIYEKIDNKLGIANSYGNIGIIYKNQGDYPTALDYYFKSLKIKEECGNKQSIALSYINIGNIFYIQGNYPSALDYCFKSLNIDEELGNKPGLARSYNNIGNIYQSQGNYSSSLTYYFKSLKIEEELGNKQAIAGSYNNIGKIYDDQGNYPSALAYYFKSLNIDEELGNKQGIARSYNNIGIIYKNQGNFPSALDYYFKSLKIQEELGNKQGIANCYNNIGIIYDYQGNYPSALAYYFKSLKIQEELGNKQGIGRSYTNIGIIYDYQGNYPSALAYYFKSLKITEELGDQQGIAMCYTNIADLLTQLSQTPDSVYLSMQESLSKHPSLSGLRGGWAGTEEIALTYYLKSVSIAEEIGERNLSTYPLRGIGSLYIKQERAREALPFLLQSIEIAKEIGVVDELSDGYKILSEAYLQLNDYKNALANHKLYVEIKDTLHNEEKSKAIGAVEVRYEFEKEQAIKKHLKEEKQRKAQQIEERENNIQYFMIFILIFTLLVILFFMVRHAVPQRFSEVMIFITFLLVFEFLLMLTEPYVDNYAGGAPMYKHGINTVIAIILYAIQKLAQNLMHGQIIRARHKEILSERGKLMGFLLIGLLHVTVSGFQETDTTKPSHTERSRSATGPKAQISNSSTKPVQPAKSKIDSLENLLKLDPSDKERIDILNNLFSAIIGTNPERALTYVKEAMQLAEEKEYLELLAESYDNIAEYHYKSGNYVESLKYLDKKLTIYEEQGNKQGMARAYNNIGLIYWNRGNYPSALDYYFKSLKIKEEIGGKQGIATSYNNIGIIYDYQGNYPSALDYYFKCLKIREEIGVEQPDNIGNKQGIGRSYNNIGIIYVNQGNYSSALDYYFKSLRIYEEIAGKQGIARSYSNIGNIYSNQGNYPIALDYYFKSLTIKEEIGDKQGISASYTNIGDLLTQLSQTPDSVYVEMQESLASYPALISIQEGWAGTQALAQEYFVKSVAIAEEIGNRNLATYPLRGIGSIYIKQNKAHEALPFLEQSKEIAKEIGALSEENGAYGLLSEAYEQLAGKSQKSGVGSQKKNEFSKKAFEYHVLYSQTKDSLFNEEKSKAIGRVETRYEIEKKLREQQYEEEQQARIAATAKGRSDKIQYFGSFIVITVVFLALFFIVRLAIPAWLGTALITIAIFMLFEFLLVLLDAQIDTLSGGKPVFKLSINTFIALCLYPLHFWMDNLFSDRMIKRKRGKWKEELEESKEVE